MVVVVDGFFFKLPTHLLYHLSLVAESSGERFLALKNNMMQEFPIPETHGILR